MILIPWIVLFLLYGQGSLLNAIKKRQSSYSVHKFYFHISQAKNAYALP